jgi:hypothetical protein
MAQRPTTLIFIVTWVFLGIGALIVLRGGGPKLPGYLWQVQETAPAFFVTRHLARIESWPAVQQKSSWTMSWTDPTISGEQTSLQTWVLTLQTQGYHLPGKWSDTLWYATIENAQGFSVSGNTLVRGESAFIQIIDTSSPQSPYPLQENPQQALHVLLSAVRLRRMELPKAVSSLLDFSSKAVIYQWNEETKKSRIVADEQDNRLYLFSWDTFQYSGLATTQSGIERFWTNDNGKISWSLQQEPKERRAILIYQQFLPVAPTIEATLSRREHRTSLEYMLAGTLSFPKWFIASFTGTFSLERSPIQPLQDIPKHPIPRENWQEITTKK